jgi:hypothetical protein
VNAECDRGASEVEVGSAGLVMSFAIDDAIPGLQHQVPRKIETEPAGAIDIPAVRAKGHATYRTANTELRFCRYRRVSRHESNQWKWHVSVHISGPNGRAGCPRSDADVGSAGLQPDAKPSSADNAMLVAKRDIVQRRLRGERLIYGIGHATKTKAPADGVLSRFQGCMKNENPTCDCLRSIPKSETKSTLFELVSTFPDGVSPSHDAVTSYRITLPGVSWAIKVGAIRNAVRMANMRWTTDT